MNVKEVFVFPGVSVCVCVCVLLFIVGLTMHMNSCPQGVGGL